MFRQSGELSHQRRIEQVLSLKYFFNGAISLAHCTSAGAGASTSLWCNLHFVPYWFVSVQISDLEQVLKVLKNPFKNVWNIFWGDLDYL